MKNDNFPQNDNLRDEINKATEDNTDNNQKSETDKSDMKSIDAYVEDTKDKIKNTPKHVKPRKDSRKLRYGSIATVLTVVVIAAVVLLNVVAGILNDRYPIKMDLSKNNQFTLTDESKEIAKNISKDVSITVFYNEDVMSTNLVLTEFHEATQTYNNLSGGKVITSYVDLAGNPTEQKKYSEMNVTQGDILFQCGNRYQKSNLKELSSTQQNQNMNSEVEKVLASKIVMVTSDNTPVISMLTGHEEDAETKQTINSTLSSNNYQVEELNITGSAEFNKQSTVAVIAAPKIDYTEIEINKLREWLNNNGKLDRQLMVVANVVAECPNLYEFLNVEYGLEVTNNLVLETNKNRIINLNPMKFYYTDILTSDYTKDFQGKPLVMTDCRQILTHNENNPENSLYNVDISTFTKSAQLVSLTDALKENTEIKPFSANEIPIGMAFATKTDFDDSTNTRHTTNILVCGSQGLFSEYSNTFSNGNNEKVLISLMNGFTGNKNTTTISSKTIEIEPLKFNVAQAYIIRFVFVIFIPITLLVVGLVVFLRRRRL